MARKKRGFSLGKLFVIVIAVVVVAVGAKIVTNVIDSPKSTIQNFETACNNLDIEGMVNCFEPEVQAYWSGIESIASMFIDMDLSDMIDGITFLAPLLDEEGDAQAALDFYLEIEIDDIEKDGDYADVYVTCYYYSQGELASEESDVISTVKIDDVWYISADELSGMF